MPPDFPGSPWAFLAKGVEFRHREGRLLPSVTVTVAEYVREVTCALYHARQTTSIGNNLFSLGNKTRHDSQSCKKIYCTVLKMR